MIPRDFAVAVLDGSIYAIGGCSASAPIQSVERYDPREDGWQMVKNLPSARFGHRAVVIHDVICTVGGTNNVNLLKSFAAYDARNNRWIEPLYCSFEGRRSRKYEYCLRSGTAHAVVAVVDM